VDKSVILGRDEQTKQYIEIPDLDRRSGLYVLGIQGSGKTTILKNLIYQDIQNGHGVFFLDPHGDAIPDLLAHIPQERKDDVFVLDPTDDTHAFGINLFSCFNPASLRERSTSYAQAEHIFTKLFANPQTAELDILLSEYLPNAFYPLIANQGYTILEIPLLLREKAFRDRLLQGSSIPAETLDFWQEEFESLRQDTQREETASTRRRINLFRSHEYVKHIVGQSKSTLDFADIMDNGRILFVKFSATLAEKVQDLIGTMLISNLVYTIFQRERIPEAERRHFCVFVDEFERFASSEDLAVLYTQGRKYAIATTVAHQERYGQLGDNKRMLGATDTAANKIFLQQAQSDAQRHAALFAKPSPTEIRLERHLGISQEPFTDLLRGHKHKDIHRFVQTYLRPLRYRLEDIREDIEYERLLRLAILDEAALSRVDERYESIQASMARGRALPVSYESLRNTEQVLLQAQEQTERLIRLYESARGLRLSIRSLNTFLIDIMEGRMQPEPGNELFTHVLLAFVRMAAPLPASDSQVFALYVSLLYGNPHLPRSLPVSQAVNYQQATEEEVYQFIVERYKKRVLDYCERVRREDVEDRERERQREHDQVIKKIFTWKPELPLFSDEDIRRFYRFLHRPEVRSFLTPYFFAKFTPFAPPGYYGETIKPLHLRGTAPLEEWEEPMVFLRQYGEGAWVTFCLLDIATKGRGYDSANAGKENIARDIRGAYPNLHMLQLPTIVGKTPYDVWQLIRQLTAKLGYIICPDMNLDPNISYPIRKYMALGPVRREDAILLSAELRKMGKDARPGNWWSSLDEPTRNYLIFRACDLVTFGEVVADRTFPQPNLAGVPPQKVARVVTALMALLVPALAEAHANLEQAWVREKEAFLTLMLWTKKELLEFKAYNEVHHVVKSEVTGVDLPPRVLTPENIETLKTICRKELKQSASALETVDAFVTFCQLLRQPENHVRSVTPVYVEREVNTYPTVEMINQMARELMDLQPHSAYVKLSGWQGKIQTLPFAPAWQTALVDMRMAARQNAIKQGILKPRSVIEKEISDRQEKWRRRPGNEPPPPTSTGGNSPPVLPSGSAGSDREASPTHSIPEKAPEEKPRGRGAVRESRVVQGRGSEQKTGQRELKREEKSAALRAKLIPIVQQALARFEEKSKTEIDSITYITGSIQNAAICAIALREKAAAERLLSQIVKKNFNVTNSIAGRLYIVTGDEEKAKSIIQSLENRNANSAAYIAAELSDKTIAKRLIRVMAEGSERYQAAVLAIKIDDKEVIARMLEEEEQSFNTIHYEILQLLVSYNPKRVKKLLKRHEDAYQKQGLLAIVGEIAALRGDNATAKRALHELKAKEVFYNCCDIAAIMGDVSTAIAMMWEYRKKDVRWFNDNYEHLRFSVSWHNPESRYHLMQALQEQGYDVGLIAARLLEYVGSISS